MDSSSIVIKVKYGKTNKRFRVAIQKGKLALDNFKLREKIRCLFNIASGKGFNLKYYDELNDDLYTLSANGDDELDDIVQQGLNPLYMIVKNKKSSPNSNKKSNPSSGPLSNFGAAAQTVNSSTLHPQSQTVNPAISQTQKTQLQQQLSNQKSNTQAVLSAARYTELVQKITAEVIKQLYSNATVLPKPFGSLNVNGQTMNTPLSQTLNPAIYAQSVNTLNSQTVNPAVYAQTLNTPNSQTLNHALNAQTLNQTINPAVYAQTLNTPNPQTIKSPVYAQTLNTPQSQTQNPPVYAQTLNTANSQTVKPAIYGQTLSTPYIQTVKPAVYGQTMNTPNSHFNQFSNIAAQTVNSSPLQSQTVTPVVSQTQNTLLQQNLKQTVQKFNAGVIQQPYLNPGFTFKAGASGQQTTCGLSNVDGQQSDKLQVNPESGSKTSTDVNLPPVEKNDLEVVNEETDSGNKLLSGSDSVFDTKEVKTALESARVEVTSDDQKQSLLNDLDKMGFKQLDLNREILKKNNYDLKNSMDDLCGVLDWDPMLEELQELGITNVEALKKKKKNKN